jgi:hypothetical protein
MRFTMIMFTLLALNACKTVCGGETTGYSPTRPLPPRAAPVDVAPPVPAPAPAARSADDIFPVPDPAHVDLQVIAAQALDLARKEEPAVWLNVIRSTPKVIGGSVDLTKGAGIDYEFAYRKEEPAVAPGRDSPEGLIVVTLNTRIYFGVHERRVIVALVSRRGASDLPKPRDLPRCTLARAWAKAVETGVPSNAIARVRYTAIRLDNGTRPFVWDFTVDDHDEFTRSIDADTCELKSRLPTMPPGAAPLLKGPT